MVGDVRFGAGEMDSSNGAHHLNSGVGMWLTTGGGTHCELCIHRTGSSTITSSARFMGLYFYLAYQKRRKRNQDRHRHRHCTCLLCLHLFIIFIFLLYDSSSCPRFEQLVICCGNSDLQRHHNNNRSSTSTCSRDERRTAFCSSSTCSSSSSSGSGEARIACGLMGLRLRERRGRRQLRTLSKSVTGCMHRL